MSPSTRPTLLACLLAVAALSLGARDQTGSSALPAAGPQEVSVLGVVVDPATQRPTVVLQGKRDRRAFAMVIGPAEATGIALPLSHVTPPRPLTHDLFLTVFGRLQVTVTRAVITDLRDDTFYATLFLSVGGTPMELDSRPSDAIAIAIRAKAPVFAEDRVFDKTEPPTRSGPRI